MRFLFIVLCLLPAIAMARPVELFFALPTTDCAGDPINAADYESLEIYFDTIPIPASDIACPTAADPVDIPPGGATVLTVLDTTTTSITTDLAPGTYYARMRGRAAGLWSNLSNQSSQVIPEATRPPPQVLRWEL